MMNMKQVQGALSMSVGGIASLDKLLRSVTQHQSEAAEELTESSAANEAGSFSISVMVGVLIALAMFYGLCMGSYSLFKPLNLEVAGYADRWLQLLASMVKVPFLYLLTIMVTFPSLYVFSALVGTQLSFHAFIRLMITLLAINLAVLASLGPIVAFFSVSTINYRFMQVFNVGMFSIAGGLGLAWLLHVIRGLSEKVMGSIEVQDDRDSESETCQVPPQLMPVKWIFRIWIVAFCLVGSQLGWVLRPFIGNPDIAFTWFRERESNFFLALLDILKNLFS
jgi:hypothetical protein